MCGTKRSRAGYGMREITARVRGLASVCGRRQDTAFLELKALLELFGITRSFTDGWGAYERHLEAEQHTVGKAHAQKIEASTSTCAHE